MTLFTIREAAAHCKVSERTIYRWIAEGRIEATRLGPTLLRIDEQALGNLRNPVIVRSVQVPDEIARVGGER